MNDKLQRILADINSSTKKVQILPCDCAVRQSVKEKYMVPSESILGILLENTGGITIDNWIRIYGSGELNIVSRNALFPYDELVIAEDILGGLFICLKNGNIGYFAPDCLDFEDMEIYFNQFLYWCLHGDTDTFYMDYRWTNWQADVLKLKLDEGIAFYPFLWAQAESLESRKHTIIPINEIIGLELDFYKQDHERRNGISVYQADS
ncbi:MAG: DUF2625 domain-containing protein [Lachnoclostridium sp.]|nr:DUF2625 domain-containing protein [Lachnoclostridium sp.]MCM1384392.1 DUF2625 domain-containing protein [Lachnoclostridium sp.]